MTKRNVRRLGALAVTVLVFVFIFWKVVDFEGFKKALLHLDLRWFAASLLLFVPQSLVAAYRWVLVARVSARLPLGESLKMLMAGNTLNLVLPSKMGDLVRGYWIHRHGNIPLKRGLNVVVFEKLTDLGALALMIPIGVALRGRPDAVARTGLAVCAICVVTLALVYAAPLYRIVPGTWKGFGGRFLAKVRAIFLDTHEMVRSLVRARGRFAAILSLTILIWFLHVLQFVAFFRAVRSDVDFAIVFARVPLAILVGLIPVTIAGMGTRDSALILVMKGFVEKEKTAVVGILSILRYLVPGVAGIPFLNRYMAGAEEARAARAVEAPRPAGLDPAAGRR